MTLFSLLLSFGAVFQAVICVQVAIDLAHEGDRKGVTLFTTMATGSFMAALFLAGVWNT